MSMIVQVFGQRLFHEHDIVRVFGRRLFHEHERLPHTI